MQTFRTEMYAFPSHIFDTPCPRSHLMIHKYLVLFSLTLVLTFAYFTIAVYVCQPCDAYHTFCFQWCFNESNASLGMLQQESFLFLATNEIYDAAPTQEVILPIFLPKYVEMSSESRISHTIVFTNRLYVIRWYSALSPVVSVISGPVHFTSQELFFIHRSIKSLNVIDFLGSLVVTSVLVTSSVDAA